MTSMRSAAVVLAATAAIGLTSSSTAGAHNRAHIILPSGECIIVGSEKSVMLPDGSLLDLRPETTPQDEIGTAFVAAEGNPRVLLGPCP